MRGATDAERSGGFHGDGKSRTLFGSVNAKC